MSVRISGLFASVDAAELAVRNLEDIPIHARRISRPNGKPYTAESRTQPDGSGANAVLFGSVGQGMSQGVYVPNAAFLGRRKQNASRQEAVRLEVWGDTLDAPEIAGRFYNSHATGVQIF